MLLNKQNWGSNLWKLKHIITVEYPIVPTAKDINAMKNFIYSLPLLLPCNICKIHYEYILSIHPLTDDILNVKIKLITWMVEIHNIMNVSLGKQEMPFEEAMISLFYENNTKCIHNCLNLTETNIIEQNNEIDKYMNNYCNDIQYEQSIDLLNIKKIEKIDYNLDSIGTEQRMFNFRKMFLNKTFENIPHKFTPITSINMKHLIVLFKQKIDSCDFADYDKKKELFDFLNSIIEAIITPFH